MPVSPRRWYSASRVVAVLLVFGTAPVHGQDSTSQAQSLFARAESQRVKRDKESAEQAINLYRQVLQLAPTDATRAVRAKAQLELGVTLRFLGRVAEALPVLKGATESLHQVSDAPHEAEALAAYGDVLERSGNHSGLAAIRQGIVLARTTGDRRTLALTLATLGWIGSPDLPEPEKRGAVDEAIAIARTLPDQVILADALLALSLITGDHDAKTSADARNEALTVARAAGDANEIGEALSIVAYGVLQTGDSKTAAAELEESLAYTRKAGDRIQEGYTLDSLGLSLYYLGATRLALQYFEQSLAFHRDIGDRSFEGSQLNNIGLARITLGDVKEAEAIFNQALDIHRANQNLSEQVATLINLAAVRSAEGDSVGELAFFEKALGVARQDGGPRHIVAAQERVGVSQVGLGRYREGIENLASANEMARKNDFGPEEAAGERGIGRIYWLIGDRVTALSHLNRSIEINERLKQTFELAAALSQAAAVKAEMGEMAGVPQMLDRALALVHGGQQPEAEARVLNCIALVAMATGDIARAVRTFEQEAAVRAQPGVGGSDEVLVGLAKASESRRDWSKAQDYFQRALLASYATHDPAGEAVALTGLMETARAERRPAAAVFFGKQAIDIFQTARANLFQLDVTTQRAYIDSRANIYRELADLLISEGRLPEAQQILSLLKQQEFLDFIRRDGSTGARDDKAELTRAEAEERARYEVVRDRVIEIGRERGELMANQRRTHDDDVRLASLDNDQRLANKACNDTLTSLANDLRSPVDTKVRATAIANAQSIMDALDDTTVAVYTLVGETKFSVVIFTANARKAVQLPVTGDVVRQRIVAFHQVLQDPHLDPRPAARDLYDVVVKPIEKDLAQAHARTILWNLDGMLRYVPMAALFDGQHYLAERYQSIVLTASDQRPGAAAPPLSKTGLGVGVSKSIGDFPALPGVAGELHHIFRESPGADGVLDGHVLLDESFTVDALRESLRTATPVLHVASHFQFHPGDATDSFLLLGDGGHFTLADLQSESQLFRGVDLLTLSACNTAVGSDASGAEIESLGTIAQRQGAKSVIAGLWSVADESTSLLMQQFYRARVNDGVTTAEALRRAQVQLITGSAAAAAAPQAASSRGVTVGGRPFAPPAGAPWSHPYYWAPFIVIGNK